MQENINIPDSTITTNLSFRQLVLMNMQQLTNFPYIEKDFDALTDYELLCLVVKYLNDVIANQNEQNASITRMYQSFLALQDYVNNTKDELEDAFNNLDNYVRNYFDNLDVQDEIDNKLDEYVADGTLEHIIASYLQTQKIYDTTDEMIADASTLVDGLSVQTLGYHSLNDEGGAFFKITDTASVSEFQIDLGNDLYATLIIEGNTLNVKQFGAYGDNTHDDTNAFKNAITFINGKYINLYINKGTYKITEPLYVDWQNSNFWTSFDGSYSIKGAGIYQSILNFTSSNGLIINRNTNILSIEISDFSIENLTYDPLQESTVSNLPDDTKGIGLLLKHIGYTGHVSRVGVRGFYIGIATRNCYCGPILDNLFSTKTVFGYSSKDDTSVEHNSCSYTGYESCYIQQGSDMTLTNVICEGNLGAFKTNEYNQRGKFNARGFSFYSARCNLFACYSEQLMGNARYIDNSVIVEDNGVIDNNMVYYLDTAAYADLKTWVLANNWNYDEIYVNNTISTFCQFNAPFIENRTAYIYDASPRPGMKVDSDGKYFAPNIIFNGVTPTQGADNTFNLLSHGNAKPIVYLKGALYEVQDNYKMAPQKIYGLIRTRNNIDPTNWSGGFSLDISRLGNYTDETYNEVSLKMRHTLDGGMIFYKETLLDGTRVAIVPIINIAADGKVTFPQN